MFLSNANTKDDTNKRASHITLHINLPIELSSPKNKIQETQENPPFRKVITYTNELCYVKKNLTLQVCESNKKSW